MYLTNHTKKQLLIFYCICFTISYFILWNNHLLLHQLKPVFFANRLDVTLNVFMLSNLHKALLANSWIPYFLDYVYLILPLILLVFFYKKSYGNRSLAWLLFIFNFIYALLYSLVSIVSIEIFLPWLILPLLFATKSEKTYYYLYHSTRYFFILIFASAGFWKIRAGGVFNLEQMSAVLLYQHADILASSSSNWYKSFIIFFLEHKSLSYLLYFGSMLMELFVLLGFFTKKFDKLLIAIIAIFIFFDYVFMGINYFNWISFAGCFWFSKYALKE